MTDRFTLIDAGLWSVAAALLLGAVWIVVRERPERWDHSFFFVGVLGALFGKGKLPLREGPIAPEGWDGEPAELGPEHAPDARLGPGLTWEDVAAWRPAVVDAITRRLTSVEVLCLDPLPMEIPGVAVRTVTIADLDGHFTRAEQRAVFVAGASADALLRALRASPPLRDRARAVLLVAPTLDRTFLPSIDHLTFEVDVAREVPYLTLRSGPAAADQLLPDPPKPPSGILSLITVDLGILPEALLGDPRVGRALAALLAST